MNKHMKSKWVKALKSGDYRKARESLSSRGGFCCLGVLCEITKVEYSKTGSWLPESLADRSGLSHQVQVALAALNDGDMDSADLETLGLKTPPKGYVRNRGAPFPVVAAVIREKL